MKTSLSITLLAAATVVMLSGCASRPSRPPSLHDAVIGGDINSVSRLIKSGADVNATDEYGYTPLRWAFTRGDTELVKMLINNGADVNARDKNGWTHLMFAVMGGHTEFAKLLIDKGANVNAKASNGWTALHIAAQFGYIGDAKLLLGKGADVNARGKDGWTPLMVAATTEIANFLISKGADVNARHSDGRIAKKVQLDFMKQQKKNAEVVQQQKAVQQKQEELAQQQQQNEQQRQQTSSNQGSSGGGSGVVGSMLRAYGAGIGDQAAAKIRADNTVVSNVVGGTMSNMSTQIRNNDTSGTLGSGIADAAGASIRDNAIGMATAKAARGGISGSGVTSANSVAGTRKNPPSAPSTGGSGSGTSALIGRWAHIGTYWGSGPPTMTITNTQIIDNKLGTYSYTSSGNTVKQTLERPTPVNASPIGFSMVWSYSILRTSAGTTLTITYEGGYEDKWAYEGR